jgi:hypothetical protein
MNKKKKDRQCQIGGPLATCAPAKGGVWSPDSPTPVAHLLVRAIFFNNIYSNIKIPPSQLDTNQDE